MKTVFGWQAQEKFYVSLFPKPKEGEKVRPVNEYETQAAAIQQAEKRGVSIEWQQ